MRDSPRAFFHAHYDGRVADRTLLQATSTCPGQPPGPFFSKGPSIAGRGLAVIWGCWCPPCGSHKRSVNMALAISSTATKDFASLVMGGLSFAGAWAQYSSGSLAGYRASMKVLHTITQR